MLLSYNQRVIKEGQFIADNNETIRSAAKQFGVSKSCVHKDIHHKLKYLNPSLYKSVLCVLEKNFSEKHLRGGIATKKRFETKQKNRL
ncbi:MAG: sporulation transcriptional regulator SpoIIID [Clostridia bacterium]|nr:sporulation transcriptional regulator SpoIIID [Clostridia bacterium]